MPRWMPYSTAPVSLRTPSSGVPGANDRPFYGLHDQLPGGTTNGIEDTFLRSVLLSNRDACGYYSQQFSDHYDAGNEHNHDACRHVDGEPLPADFPGASAQVINW